MTERPQHRPPKRLSQDGLVTLVRRGIPDFSGNLVEVEYPDLRGCARSESTYGFV